ncbi:MAG: threonine/serine exporter family protein [Deltaproteobacteria bacterium]|nr:threonine/serine exporter family protein [Deltaproteobacteria bacterium]
MDTLSTTLDAVCLASQTILESGGETYRAEETVERMCQGLGIPKVDVLALPTGLMLTVTLDDDSALSRIVRVHDRSTDLGRMDQCNDISRKVASGHMSAEEALKALRAIRRSTPQRRRLLVGASALSAASFTVMLGGSGPDFIVSFFCGALVQLVLPPLQKLRVPVLISSMIAGALTTLMALVSASLLPGVNVEPVMSGAIMPLLPGLAVTNAMRDTIRGDLVSGGARTIEAILSVMMLAAGIGLVLSMWGGISA